MNSMQGLVVLQKRYDSITSGRIYNLTRGLLVIGKNKHTKTYFVLKMKRPPNTELHRPLKSLVAEEKDEFTAEGVNEYLKRSKLDTVKGEKIYGLLGFIKFLAGYYLVVITQKQRVTKICGHSIYSLSGTSIYPLFVPGNKDTKYLEMLNSILQIGKDFYFSYTYDLTFTLQDNVIKGIQEKTNINTEFVWNWYLLSEFVSIVKRPGWILPVIFGFVGSAEINNIAFPFSIHIIGRRSRFYAGTRYLTRGVNEQGKTGNFVEIEQIVEDRRQQTPGRISASSYVHIRGSIPVLWRQGSATKPKPEIITSDADYMHTLTKVHISDLIKRYGKPLVLVNLTKVVLFVDSS